MDADQGRGLAGNVPHAQHDGFLSTGAVPGFESEDPEMAEPAGEIGLGYFLQHHRGTVLRERRCLTLHYNGFRPAWWNNTPSSCW